MSIILFDTPSNRSNLLPLTFTRPSADIRVGIQKISKKWARYNPSISYLTEGYLQPKFKVQYASQNIYVHGSVCPNEKLISLIETLENDEGILVNGELSVFKSKEEFSYPVNFQGTIKHELEIDEITLIGNTWDIFKHNRKEIIHDFQAITSGRTSEVISDKHTIVYNEDQIFVETGVKIKSAILNAESGPIYLGKNSTVHEGAIIRGAFALGEGAHLNMGAKIKGDTTIGPQSKVGGEVSNSVIFGFSNKGHDGFLGNSVIGEWCNLGADTNTSNLKNNYTSIKLWNYADNRFVDSGEQFCGLMMGDHSKCGINTMFNTGTVVGVGANIYGAGFPRTFIPSFSWGGAGGMTSYKLDRFFETAEIVMKRRKVDLTDIDKKIISTVFDKTMEKRS